MMHKNRTTLKVLFLLATITLLSGCNKWDYEDGRYLYEEGALVHLEHHSIGNDDIYVHWSEGVTEEQQEVVRNLIDGLVKINGNTFQMGAQATNPAAANYDAQAASDEGPVHSVTVGDYFLCNHEITREEWSAVMGESSTRWADNEWGSSLQCPANGISYNEACNFVRALQTMTGLAFRMPTEAEWEFAARGGNPAQMSLYSEGDVWCYENAQYTLHPSSYQGNSTGLYNMCGNVAEWCSDFYGSYTAGSQTNPTGPATGDNHVLKGGSFCYMRDHCRCTSRDSFNSSDHTMVTGFRIALSIGD